MVDIRNEARKHLLEFLIKILDDSYTLNEVENGNFSPEKSNVNEVF